MLRVPSFSAASSLPPTSVPATATVTAPAQQLRPRPAPAPVPVPVSTLATGGVGASEAEADAREEEEERRRIALQMEQLMRAVPDHFDGAKSDHAASSTPATIIGSFVSSRLKW